MSSLTRRIQRTVKRDDDGVVVDTRHHHGGRGSTLGVVNPKDPCRTHRRKPKKPSRVNREAAKPRPSVAQVYRAPSKRDRAIAHAANVARKKARPRKSAWSPPPTANVSRRHPDAELTPGQHARCKAERML